MTSGQNGFNTFLRRPRPDPFLTGREGSMISRRDPAPGSRRAGVLPAGLPSCWGANFTVGNMVIPK